MSPAVETGGARGGGRRAWAIIAAMLLVACLPLAAGWMLGVSVRIGALEAVNSTWYSRVYALVETMPPPERERLLAAWAANTPEGYYGFITHFELHRVLVTNGYCSNLVSWRTCKEAPWPGEAIGDGMAKERLDGLAARYRSVSTPLPAPRG